MKIITSTNELKYNFLELAEKLTPSQSQSLIDFDNTSELNLLLSSFCSKSYPIEKVLLIFHRYACVAYLSAEFIKNAKVYLDYRKENFILLSFLKENEPDDSVSVVYSNVKQLSQNPTKPILIKDLIGFLEQDNIKDLLISFYENK